MGFSIIRDKKILITGLVLLILVLGIGFATYQYFYNDEKSDMVEDKGTTQDDNLFSSQDNTDSVQTPGQQILTPEQPQESGNKGGLSICVDGCGDGICQDVSTTCEEGNLNCICFEDKLDCPEDCK